MNSAFKNEIHPGEAPPVKQRPICPACRNTLAVSLRYANDDLQFAHIVKHGVRMKRGKVTGWHFKSYGHFCSMRCATRFANRIVDGSPTSMKWEQMQQAKEILDMVNDYFQISDPNARPDDLSKRVFNFIKTFKP